MIYLNIVATLPRALGSTIELAQSGDRSTVGGIVVLVLVFIICMAVQLPFTVVQTKYKEM